MRRRRVVRRDPAPENRGALGRPDRDEGFFECAGQEGQFAPRADATARVVIGEADDLEVGQSVVTQILVGRGQVEHGHVSAACGHPFQRLLEKRRLLDGEARVVLEELQRRGVAARRGDPERADRVQAHEKRRVLPGNDGDGELEVRLGEDQVLAAFRRLGERGHHVRAAFVDRLERIFPGGGRHLLEGDPQACAGQPQDVQVGSFIAALCVQDGERGPGRVGHQPDVWMVVQPRRFFRGKQRTGNFPRMDAAAHQAENQPPRGGPGQRHERGCQRHGG